MQLLVITKQSDPHVNHVLPFLDGIDVQFFDPSIISDSKFSFQSQACNYSLIISGTEINPDAIWFRKPVLIKKELLPIPREFQELAYDNFLEVTRWVYSLFPNANWVSDYWCISRSSSKWLQLNTAAKLGMYTPKTLCTRSELHAREFISKMGSCIVKPANMSFVKYEGSTFGYYTRRIHDVNQVDFSGLFVSPTFFQQEIIGSDIRLVVMGNNYYPYIIKVNPIDFELDWRRNQFDHMKIYHDSSFPESLGNLCVQMVSELGLKFGVFDFIRESKTGKYYFLELNPNGQWAFLDLHLSEDILLKRMAKLLREGS